MPAMNLVYHGTGSVSVLGPKIWNIVPDRLNNIISLEAFKSAIKSWKPEKCHSQCRFYLKKSESYLIFGLINFNFRKLRSINISYQA